MFRLSQSVLSLVCAYSHNCVHFCMRKPLVYEAQNVLTQKNNANLTNSTLKQNLTRRFDSFTSVDCNQCGTHAMMKRTGGKILLGTFGGKSSADRIPIIQPFEHFESTLKAKPFSMIPKAYPKTRDPRGWNNRHQRQAAVISNEVIHGPVKPWSITHLLG